MKAQFSGAYAFANWQMVAAAQGGVANGAPGFIVVTGPDGLTDEASTDFSIVVPETAMISFNWNYTSDDAPGYDPSYYTINNEAFLISQQPGTSGTKFVVVEAGETFGFRITATDGCCGSAYLNISNFAAGDLIPGLACETAAPVSDGGHSVPVTASQFYWYSYTMPDTPGKRLSIQSEANKVVTIFTGDCEALEFAGTGFAQAKVAGLLPGQNVLVRWTTTGGNFPWTIAAEDVVPGDACDVALAAVVGENVLPAIAGQVWYTFTMPEGANKTLVAGMDGDLNAAIYFGDCSDPEHVVDGDGGVWIEHGPEQQLFIVWNNTNGESIPWTLTLDGDGSSCENAVSAGVGVNYSPQAPRWFTYTMPADGDLRITSLDEYGTNPDTYLDVLNLCNTTPFATNDNFSSLQSEVTLTLEHGQQILIHWDDKYSSEHFFWEIDLSNLKQEIEFSALDVKNDQDASFELSAVASSGLPVSYTSQDPSIASISGNVVTIHSSGKVDISAHQPGNEDYLPAEDVIRELVIKQSQSITFEEIPAKQVNNAPFALTASATSGLPVSFQSSNPSVATISGNTVTIVADGTTTITASQVGDDGFMPALSVGRVLTVTKVSQQITFDPLPAKIFNSPPFDLTASATSGLPVSFHSSNESVATISGTTVSIVGGGSTTITASQAGDATYDQAGNIERILVVSKLTQQITFAELEPKSVNSPPFSLTASSDSGLPVTFQSGDLSVATISGNTLTMIGGGTTTITALQAGNGSYDAASQVRVLTVNKLSQILTFTSLQSKRFNDAPFELVGSASSGLTVSFESNNPSVVSVQGNVATVHAAGIAVITARQTGNSQYAEANTVERTLTVDKADQTLSFNPIEDRVFPAAPILLDATATSALPVTYESSDQTVATVVGQTLTIHAPGSVTITAIQMGNTNYESAAEVARTFCVKPAVPTIESSFANPEAPILTSSNPAGNQWYRNGEIIDAATAATFTIAQSGEYKVGSTTKSCMSELSEGFVVLITSIGNEASPISVHPNPATESLTIKGVTKFSKLKISSPGGRDLNLKMSWHEQEKSMVVDISSLSSGVYYLQSEVNAGIRVTKFIKH